MTVEQTYLKGCLVIKPNIFKDDRGYFLESFNNQEFEQKTGVKINFVQDNQSVSKKGVVRGLHFQQGEFAQAKLVQVARGKILDVAVDIRPNSKTFGEYISVILSEQNNKQLFIPRGFAHGFSCLEDNTVVCYKCDNYYNKNQESGIAYNDSSLNIDWSIDENKMIISKKDRELSPLKAIF